MGIEGLDALQDRVFEYIRCEPDLRRGAAAVMSLVVPAQHIPVEVEPVLEAVARRAYADDGTAIVAIALKALECCPRSQQPSREDDDHVGVVDRRKRLFVLFGLKDDEFALGRGVGVEVVTEDDERLLRVVLEGSGQQNNAEFAQG